MPGGSGAKVRRMVWHLVALLQYTNRPYHSRRRGGKRLVALLHARLQRFRVAGKIVFTVSMLAITSKALLDEGRRALLLGKIRRCILTSIPFLSQYLQARYHLVGGCKNCGASCQILLRCPFWNSDTRLCSVYEYRPKVCRMFPITPSDLRDRASAAQLECGYTFLAGAHPKPISLRSLLNQRGASGGSPSDSL